MDDGNKPLCGQMQGLFPLGEALFEEAAECREQTPGGCLLRFSCLVTLGLEQDVHRLGVVGDRLDVDS